MNSNANDDFTRVHQAMVDQIKARMAVVRTVTAYNPLTGNTIKTPAVLLEAVEMKPGRPVTGGRLPVTVEFAAHCCLSVKTEAVELEVRNFAARLLQVISGNTWGLGEMAERPDELSAFPGMFNPDDKGFESWVVSWQQTFHLGEVWQDADFLPTDVYIGEAPNVGAAHHGDYQKVTNV